MNKFNFTSKLWLWQAEKGSWHFLTLPEDISAQISFMDEFPKVGFGSVRVEAKIGKTSWKTSIFPSKELKSYILPVKKLVRDTEKLKLNNTIKVQIVIQV